ncbi:MAG: lipid-A-disaccharide synthase [Bacteroidales bacterium]|nr:lipid-A-disaccharide synthase [Bacteroidales bacterium]
MKYFLIAGEASGDLHASALIAQLKQHDPKAEFAFLGGDLMTEASGAQPVIHYRDMAYMGFWEVLKHSRSIMLNFKAARKAISEFRPDALILIDYPSFNLKMAKYAKGLGIKTYYYISPKVWAWKEWRVKTIKKVIDGLFAIFPFEVDFYRKHGYEVKYVGNPSVEEIDRYQPSSPTREEFIKRHKLQDKQIVALLPGSRMSEIRCNLPIMTQVMRQFPQYRGVVAGAPGIDPEVYKQFTTLPVVYNETYDLLAVSRAALVTSGTATLETALMGVPQVAMYRNNGSKLFRKGKEKLIKVKYVTLPNLIVNRELIPELIFDQCTVDAVAQHLGILLPDRAPRQSQLSGYAEMRALLGTSNAPSTAALSIIN